MLDPYAWTKHRVTYYNAAPRYAPEVRAAVRAWNTSGVRFRFVPGPPRGADVTIRIGALPTHVPGLTHAVYGSRSHRLMSATVFLRADNLKPNWPPRVARYFATLAVVHELGHAMGLDHERRTCASMNPAFPLSCPRPKESWRFHCRLLHADDVAGAIRRYGGHARRLGPQVCDVSPRPPSATGLTVAGDAQPEVRWQDPGGGGLYHVLLRRKDACPTGRADPLAEEITAGRVSAGSMAVPDGTLPAGSGRYCYAVIVFDRWAHPSRVATAWYDHVSPPQAGFSWKPDAANAHHVVFADTSTDAGGRITSWRWDFGDGYSSPDQNPSHIYGSGSYTVVLTITDDQGRTSAVSQRVTVG